MFIFSAVFFGFTTVLIPHVIIIYNSLVKLKHNTAKAWSTIDVLLKQRQQCISSLVEAITGKRAFYNQSANDNNIHMEQFPALIRCPFI